VGQLFSRILLFARQHRSNPGIEETLKKLALFLAKKSDLYLETSTADYFGHLSLPTLDFDQLDQANDLVIVIGGDGSLLSAARQATLKNAAILGINRGYLGFLTDILPNEMETKITEILNGEYLEEHRFLLNTTVQNQSFTSSALNDIVLTACDTPHMIRFEIYVDSNLVCSQRADGLIITTPTGSTAYALSGGGPILHPTLNAIALVPMFPHTLSSRPIVIDADSELKIKLSGENNPPARLRCDGDPGIFISSEDEIFIQKKTHQLRLIHPKHYNYYENLGSKLGWER